MSDQTPIPISRFKLTQEQWSGIVSCSDLPAGARPFIESAIESYRAMADAIAPNAAKIRERLRRLSKQVSSIRKELLDLSHNSRAKVALTLALEPPQDFVAAMGACATETAIVENAEALDRLSRWLATGEAKLLPARHGAREKSVVIQLFVTHLDQILFQFTGRTISRSNNRGKIGREYIGTVCKIADRTIGASSIEEAMKRQITARGKITPRKSAELHHRN